MIIKTIDQQIEELEQQLVSIEANIDATYMYDYDRELIHMLGCESEELQQELYSLKAQREYIERSCRLQRLGSEFTKSCI